MREFRLGVRLEVTFQSLPVSALIRDFLTGSTHGEQPAQQFHLFECILQFGD